MERGLIDLQKHDDSTDKDNDTRLQMYIVSSASQTTHKYIILLLYNISRPRFPLSSNEGWGLSEE